MSTPDAEGGTWRPVVEYIHELATILYVGGILSHIVISALFVHGDPKAMVVVMTYKLESAYLLILPGLALKLATDLALLGLFGERAMWLKIKLAMMALLTINAVVFLVPMMPELLALAEASVPASTLSDAFYELEAREQLVGMANILPLLTEMYLGACKPKLTGAERA